MKFLTAINLTKNEIQNVALQNLSSAPGAPVTGMIYMDTTDDVAKYYDGTAWQKITDAWVADIQKSDPITVSVSGDTVTIGISAATGAAAGSMSSGDKTKLDNATSSNTASTIVMRDASGNFSAGTITAALTGTASNASQLNGEDASYYLDRDNHTGTQAASTISDLATVVKAYRLDEFAAPTSNVSMNSHKLTNLATPTSATDAATKGYVDASAQGLDIKQSVRVATTGNITLSGTQTIDGVAVVVGDRVLVKNQTDAKNNGIYVVSASAWSRAGDADSNDKVTAGMFTFVEEGTANDNTGWVLTTNNPITVGTTNLAFAQFSGSGSIQAGDGLAFDGNILDVQVGSGLEISSGVVQIAVAYAGQASITTLGTITTGTWTASAVGVAYGGTGATTAAGARSNLGVPGKWSAALGDGTTTTFSLSHNLGTRDVVVSLRESASPYGVVFCDVEAETDDKVKLYFAVAPTSNQYRVTVVA